jgi:hypothetical protein
LCKGVAGVENRSKVIELNRLCLKYNRKNEASFLVGNSIKLLPKPKIIVSYADTAQGHEGVVYKACNFLFTGTTKPRTDMASKDGKHSRHSLGDVTQRVNRSAKHRFIFIHGSKTEKKQLLKQLTNNIFNKNNSKFSRMKLLFLKQINYFLLNSTHNQPNKNQYHEYSN